MWYYLAAIGRLPMPMTERVACASKLAGWGLRRVADYARGKELTRPRIEIGPRASAEVPDLPPRGEPLLNGSARKGFIASLPSFTL